MKVEIWAKVYKNSTCEKAVGLVLDGKFVEVVRGGDICDYATSSFHKISSKIE